MPLVPQCRVEAVLDPYRRSPYTGLEDQAELQSKAAAQGGLQKESPWVILNLERRNGSLCDVKNANINNSNTSSQFLSDRLQSNQLIQKAANSLNMFGPKIKIFITIIETHVAQDVLCIKIQVSQGVLRQLTRQPSRHPFEAMELLGCWTYWGWFG